MSATRRVLRGLGLTKVGLSSSPSYYMTANCKHVSIPCTSGTIARVAYRTLNTMRLFRRPSLAMVSVNNRSAGVVRVRRNFMGSFVVGSGYTTKAKHFLRIVTGALSLHPGRVFRLTHLNSSAAVDSVYAMFTRSRIVKLVNGNRPGRGVTCTMMSSAVHGIATRLDQVGNRVSAFYLANNLYRYRCVHRTLSGGLKGRIVSDPSTHCTNTVNTTLDTVGVHWRGVPQGELWGRSIPKRLVFFRLCSFVLNFSLHLLSSSRS